MTDSEHKPVFGQRAPAAPAAPRLRPVNREQLLMLQIDVERLIPEDHPARGIWEFVGKLELQPFYEEVKAVEGHAGQPAFDPRLLISIWVYGLSRGISSARELSEWCNWEPGLQWLCGMGSVNYHSLSTFRAKHGQALQRLFIELLGVMQAAGLVGLERLAVDGTRIRAHCSDEGFRQGQRLQECLKQASAHLEALAQEGEDSLSAREQAARERSRRERQEQVAAARSVFEQLQRARGEAKAAEIQVKVSEPEARIMKQSGGSFAPSYNLQLATDEKEKIIVALVASDSGADMGLLPEVMDEVKQTCGKLPQQVLVDGGYVSAENLEQSQQRGVELIGPVPDVAAAADKQAQQRGISQAYRKEAFAYDQQTDTYRCPQGKLLIHIKQRPREGGRVEHEYRAKRGDCDGCAHKTECCPTALTQGRTVTRSEPNPLMAEFRQKMQTEAYQQHYRRRSEVAEFPNAWIKEKLGLRRFRLRGITKIATESLWAVITYNVQQWIRLSWRPQLQQAAVV